MELLLNSRQRESLLKTDKVTKINITEVRSGTKWNIKLIYQQGSRDIGEQEVDKEQ